MLPLLSTKEITVVFANVEDLLLTNTVGCHSMQLSVYFYLNQHARRL